MPTIKQHKYLIKDAIALQQQGKISEAQLIYEKLIAKSPTDSNLLFLLGSSYGQLGSYKQSIRALQKSIALNPNYIDAYNNLAIAYEYSDKLEQAVKIYNQALEIHPQSIHTLNNLGDLHRKLGNFDLAMINIENSLAISDKNENALLNKATILAQFNYLIEAKQAYEVALKAYPNNVVLLSNYSAFLQLIDENVRAESLVRKAVQLAPNYPQALSNLANVLMKKELFIESEKLLRKALSINALLVDAHINLGLLLHNIAKFTEAIKSFDKAIELDPNNCSGHWYRSFTRLIEGNFSTAWNDYEFGLLNGERINPNFIFPKYHKDSLNSNFVLITAEQGIGDQIMFSSCIEDMTRNTKNIILECDNRLVPLFSRSFPQIEVIEKNTFDNDNLLAKYPTVSQKISIGSLPSLFRQDINDFPEKCPYLYAADEKHEKWIERYKLLGTRLKVGLSWKGGISVDHKKRSISLETLLPIIKCDCDFIDLQYGDCSAEIAKLKSDHAITIHSWPDSDSLLDIDDFAAQISALDLVISVGNTNVHLAGSLNVPTFCLIPHIPSWRWLFNGNKCLWYNSVNIYRQTPQKKWAPVIERVRNDLISLIGRQKF